MACILLDADISFKPLIGILQFIHTQRLGIEYRIGERGGPLKKRKIDV